MAFGQKGFKCSLCKYFFDTFQPPIPIAIGSFGSAGFARFRNFMSSPESQCVRGGRPCASGELPACLPKATQPFLGINPHLLELVLYRKLFKCCWAGKVEDLAQRAHCPPRRKRPSASISSKRNWQNWLPINRKSKRKRLTEAINRGCMMW